MSLLRESILYHLWLTLCSAYERSAVCRALTGIGAWCNAQIDGSRVLRLLCREGAAARAWPESFLCRALTAVVNFPAAVLHKLYRAMPRTFEDSFFARLAFSLGESTPIAQSWLIMLLWIIPYERWNNAYTLIVFAGLLVLFHAGAMRSRALRLDLAAIGIYPLVMLSAVTLGVILSFDPSLSGRFLLYHLSAALCVLVTVSGVQNTKQLKRLAAGGAFAAAVSALYGVYQRIQGVEVNASYVDLELNKGMPGRIFSFYDNPNAYAEVLILLLPLVLALVFCSKRPLGKLAACGAFAVSAAALAMTYSRASWVGFACSLVVFVFLWKPKLIPAFILLCCVAVPFLPETVWNRILTITNTSDSSTASRVPLFEAALAVIGKSPVSGAGLGSAAVQAYIKKHNLYRGTSPFVHAHNIYLQVWIEAGILGFLGFFGSMLWNIKRTARMARHTADSAARTIAVGAASALCGGMVCGLADYLWHYPRVLCIFWFVFAMALAGTKLCLQESR